MVSRVYKSTGWIFQTPIYMVDKKYTLSHDKFTLVIQTLIQQDF